MRHGKQAIIVLSLLAATCYAAGRREPKIIDGKEVRAESICPVTPMVSVSDIRFLRVVHVATGSKGVAIMGTVVSYAPSAEFTVHLQFKFTLSRQSDYADRGYAGTTVVRPAPGKPVRFSILTGPIIPEERYEQWIADGWKAQYVLSTSVMPYTPPVDPGLPADP